MLAKEGNSSFLFCSRNSLSDPALYPGGSGYLLRYAVGFFCVYVLFSGNFFSDSFADFLRSKNISYTASCMAIKLVLWCGDTLPQGFN